jgi:GMP synthase (glutamine-hydrolysing)
MATVSRPHELLLILDFGSQYTQLIARRARELGVYSEIAPFNLPMDEIRRRAPKGIVLSGGPQSVYAKGAPQGNPELFSLGTPLLGLCYGMQWACHALGGKVQGSGEREYGHAEIDLEKHAFWKGLEQREKVWMSHGDRVETLPEGFRVIASSGNSPHAAVACENLRFVGIQFHPEVAHTPHGSRMLENFLKGMCGFRGDWTSAAFIEEQTEAIRARVGKSKVICGLSGGVDSSVAATLIHEAVGGQLECIFVDTGLLRLYEGDKVMQAFSEKMHFHVRRVNAAERFFAALRGVEDPEKKRKIIGGLFVDVFAEAAQSAGGAQFLAQGTLYPDVIESTSVKGPSSTIKTHHNVGGLPDRMPFELVEPLRYLFKDEVRKVGAELGLPEEFIWRHPFPGPGLAVRVLGEITPERVALLQKADDIFISELKQSGWYRKTAQAFAVLLPVKAVGVMGDGRSYENVAALRAVTTEDFMTADWARLPEELLHRVATRIVNEVKGINRVVYDVTTKPPGTIEWE